MEEMDGQGDEFDPCEPEVLDQQFPAFDEVRTQIVPLVMQVLSSTAFFANHKFLGTPSIDMKVERWLLTKMHKVTKRSWLVQRKTVKEVLRYRRQAVVVLCQREFNSE